MCEPTQLAGGRRPARSPLPPATALAPLAAGWMIVLLILAGIATARAATAPATYAEVANRVLVIHHPNGNLSAYRVLTGGTWESAIPEGVGTFSADYTIAGLPADQGRLVLWSVNGTGASRFAQTNRYTLTFSTPAAGTYVREYNNSGLPAIQRFEGAFELSSGPNIAPLIASQPEDAAIGAGRGYSISVTAAGFSLAYQWYREGQPIPGATQRTHALSPFTAATAGAYHVVVSNPLGSATSRTAVLTVATAPTITRQPVAVTAYEGTSVRFSVEATGVPAPTYEWQLRGASLGISATGSSLSLSNLTPAMAGDYTVNVVNGEGSVTSQPATLTVLAPATNHLYRGRPWVKILRSREPVPGAPATFGPLRSPFEPQFTLRDRTVHVIVRGDNDVPVSSSGAIHRGLFRWRDGTLSTLVFTNTPRPSGGTFDDVFYLTDEEDGAVNFGSGSMYELRGAALTEVIGPNTPAPGRNNARIGGTGSYARRGSAVAISSSIVPATPPDLPIGAGIYLHDGRQLTRICDDTTDLPGVMSGYGGRTTEDAINFDGTTLVFATVASLGGAGGVYRSTTSGTITKLIDSGDLLPGLTNAVTGFGDVDVEGGSVFAIIGTRVGNPPSFAVNNRIVAFPANGQPQVLGSADYVVAAGPELAYFGNTGSIVRWSAGTSETVITTGAVLEGRRISRLFDVEAQGDDVAIGAEFQDGTVGVYVNFGEPGSGAPRILDQPKSAIVPETVPVIFGVAAIGAEPLRYQWRRGGVPIPGATSSTWSIDSTSPADLASYDVEISNAAGSVVSAPATLTLTPAPEKPLLFLQPAPVSVPIGSPVVLRVLAAGAPPLTYTWRIGLLTAPVPIPGANGPTFTTTLTSNAFFSVVVAGAGGSVTSTLASVSLQPILTRQPANQTVAAGGTATFSVEATGFASYRYFWFRDNTVLSGQTNAVLTLENVQAVDAGAYSVTVFGTGGGTIRSATATLVVGDGGTPGPVAAQIGRPSLEAGELRFTLPTVAGSNYDIQQTSGLSPAAWTTLQTVTGDGSARSIVIPATGVTGIIRVQTR